MQPKRDTPKEYKSLWGCQKYRLASDPWGKTYVRGRETEPPAEDTLVLPANEFDYIAAYEDCAYPAAAALPAHMVEAALATKKEAEGKAQGADLNIPISEGFNALDDLDDEELATLVLLMRSGEHYRPARTHDDEVTALFGWQAANVGNQVLCTRLGLPTKYMFPTQEGISFRCADGKLSATLAVGTLRRDLDTHRIVLGLATRNTLEEAKKAFEGASLDPKQFESICAELQELFCAPLSPEVRELVQPIQYHAPKGYTRHACPECGTHDPLYGWFRHATGCSYGERLRLKDAEKQANKNADEKGLPRIDVDANPLTPYEVCLRLATGYYKDRIGAAEAAGAQAINNTIESKKEN